MSDVYIIQNQDKLFLSKQRTWVDGREPAGLYRTAHRDEAINEKFEVNAKDYSQRVALVSCTLNERGVPMIDPEILPPPLPKAKDEASLTLDFTSADEAPADAIDLSDEAPAQEQEPESTQLAPVSSTTEVG